MKFPLNRLLLIGVYRAFNFSQIRNSSAMSENIEDLWLEKAKKIGTQYIFFRRFSSIKLLRIKFHS
jgi:hypothetical protein